MTDVDIFVTLSTFCEDSDEPMMVLEQSGFTFNVNSLARRMTSREVIELGGKARAFVAGLEKYDAETISQMPNISCISRCGVGIDNIDMKVAEQRNIEILNTPEEPIIAVAEMTLAMMLSLLRQLPRVNALMRDRKWKRVRGNLLADKTIGIIGMGRIGKRVIELVRAFRARVIVVDPFPDINWARENEVELVDMNELLQRAEIISIHAAPSEDNVCLLDEENIQKIRPGAWLINMARGDMVDDVALASALSSGQLSGVGMDVFSTEPYSGILCDSDRVMLSPHQATLTVETREKMELKAVKNAVDYLKAHG